MSDFLVLLNSNSGHVAGTVAEIRATGAAMTPKEMENYGIIRTIDSFIKDDVQYSKIWQPEIDFEIVNQVLSLDGFRLKLTVTNASSNSGGINATKIESFVTDWGGSVVSITPPNEIVFDISIFNALKSKNFWDVSTENVIFTETNYDQGTGIHTIELDYDALGNSPSYIENFIAEKVTIIGHDGSNRFITFEAHRSIIKAEFERDILKKLPKIHSKRFYFGSGVVSAILAAPNHILDSTISQVVSFIKDKKDD